MDFNKVRLKLWFYLPSWLLLVFRLTFVSLKAFKKGGGSDNGRKTNLDCMGYCVCRGGWWGGLSREGAWPGCGWHA